MALDVCAIERTVTDAVSAATRFTPDLMIVEERLDDGSGIVAVDEIMDAEVLSRW